MSITAKVAELLHHKDYDALIKFVSEHAFEGDLFTLDEKNMSPAMHLALAYKGATDDEKEQLDNIFMEFQSCNTGEDLILSHPVEGTILHILAEFGTYQSLHSLDTYDAYEFDLFSMKRGRDSKTIWELAMERTDEEIRDFFIGEYADILSLGNLGTLISESKVDGLKRIVDLSAERFNRTPEDVGKASRAIDSLVQAPIEMAEFCFKLGFLDFFAVPAVAEGFLRKFLAHHLGKSAVSEEKRQLVLRAVQALIVRMAQRSALPVGPEEILAAQIFGLPGLLILGGDDDEEEEIDENTVKATIAEVVRSAVRMALISLKSDEETRTPLRQLYLELAFGDLTSVQAAIESLEVQPEEEGGEEGKLPRSVALGLSPLAVASLNESNSHEICTFIVSENLFSLDAPVQVVPSFAAAGPMAEDDDGASDLYLDEDASDLEDGDFDEDAGQDVEVGKFLSVDVLNKWASQGMGMAMMGGDDEEEEDEEEEPSFRVAVQELLQYLPNTAVTEL